MKIRGTTITTPMKPEKVVVKATNLTDEEKAQVRENLGITGSGADIIKDDELSSTSTWSSNKIHATITTNFDNLEGYFSARIGDIDTALDSIIAIQNELIGGEEQ